MLHRYLLAVIRCTLLAGAALLLVAAPAAAQALATRVYSLADGLPQSTVYALAQDARGQLWAGTQGGVAWFDGRQFHTLDTRGGLPDNHVTALLPQRGGRVLLGHYYGAVSEVDSAGRVRRLGPAGWQARAVVRQLQTAAGGGLWVATAGDGLYRLPADARSKPLHLTRATGLPCDTLYQLAPGPAGELWAATAQGLAVLDAGSGRVQPAPDLPAALRQQRIYSVQRDGADTYWLGLAGGLGQLTRPGAGQAWQLRLIGAGQGLCAAPVQRVQPDGRGRVWLLTAAGVGRYETATGRAECLPQPSQLSDQTTAGLLLDREANLWVVLDDGILQHAPDEQFALFGAGQGLPTPDVQAILRLDADRYWVGTRGGLWEFRPGAPAGQQFRPGRRRAGGAGANFVRALFRDAQGRIWLGSRGGGAALYDPATESWRELNLPGLQGQNVRRFAQDRLGRVWAVTAEAGATVILDLAAGRTRRYDARSALGTNALWTAFVDHRGTLWLGTDDHGLVRVDVQADGPDGFRRVDGRRGRLSIGSISEDARGNLWLGSIGEGLLRFDGQHLRAYGPSTGLLSNNPYFAQCDAQGYVWLGTNRGLDRFDPTTGQAISYGPAEGFLGQETNQNAVLAEADGRLWVGTINGLMRYDPARARANRAAPRTRLAGVRVQGQDTTLAPGFALPHALNQLTFDFVGVSLTNPGRVRYQYRLVGFDKAWSRPGPTTSATYTNLPPGDYTFEVKAANNDGVWNRQPARLAFHIRPPWWRTWWAYGLYALLLGGAFYAVRRNTQRRERDRARQQLEYQALTHLQEMDRVKNDFFTHLSHELRTPLTLILGPAEELARDETAPAATRQQGTRILSNARKLLQLINQILDLSKLDAGGLSLNPQPGDVAAAARGWVAAFRDLATVRQVGLHVAVPPAPVPLVYDAARLEEIVSNLLANALRFTPSGGHVTLAVREEAPAPASPGGAVLISVQDTGVGIAPEHLPQLFDRFYQVPGSGAEATGSGVGLALVKELAERHGGSVQVLSTPGAGSTFVVRLPRTLTPAQPTADDPALTAPPTAPPLPEMEPEPVVAVLPAELEPAEPAADAPVVLVVEDSAEVREYIAAALRPQGYRVLMAADGPSGTALAREAVPDLVLSDVMMPGFDGYELCRQLKTDVATSHIPVVLLTARAAAADRLAGLETGADAYLAKPFDPRELRAQVRNLLALRQRSQARLRPGATELAAAPAEAPENQRPSPDDAAPTASPTEATPGKQPPRITAGGMPEVFETYAAAVAALPSLDKAFLQRVEQAVERHLDNGEFSVEMLSDEVALSRAQLHRKLKALTGEAPSDFIRGLRLRRAHVLLAARAGTVSEVAYQVGFNSPAHFSTSFSRQFGYAPSEVPALVLE
jgi:signal transduction histidine kinase/ligand-binding sensor domain-containing protein/DNA-binding response OmpR family regulator/AraC-like DNA-binding protein